jgi:hypothetical protein
LNGIDRAMPSDSTKTLDDLREEVSFHVGGVKNPRFLFPAKKAVDVRREVVLMVPYSGRSLSFG